MKALVFQHSLAREAAATIGGRVDQRAFGPGSRPCAWRTSTSCRCRPPDWVRVDRRSRPVRVRVKQILLNGSRDNPLTALVSFPHVLGHEVVGRRADTGERVVLNPWLSCGPRGIDPPCPACRVGRTRGAATSAAATCRSRFTSGTARRRPARTRSASPRTSPSCSRSRPHSRRGRGAGRPGQRLPPLDPARAAAGGSGRAGLRIRHAGLRGDRAAALPVSQRGSVGGDPAGASGPSSRPSSARTRPCPRRPTSSSRRSRARVGTTPLDRGASVTGCRTARRSSTTRSARPRPWRPSLRLLATGGTLMVSGVEPPKRFEWTPLYFKELRVIGSNGFGSRRSAGSPSTPCCTTSTSSPTAWTSSRLSPTGFRSARGTRRCWRSRTPGEPARSRCCSNPAPNPRCTTLVLGADHCQFSGSNSLAARPCSGRQPAAMVLPFRLRRNST